MEINLRALIHHDVETAAKRFDFGRLAALNMLADYARGQMTDAPTIQPGDFLRKMGASSDLIMKANEVDGGLTATNWGNELASPGIIRAFIEGLAHQSVFAAVLTNGATRLPLETNLGSLQSAATGAIVAEGAAIPASAMGFSADVLPRKKAAAMIAVSAELLRDAAPGTIQWLQRELGKAVTRAMDAQALTTLKDSITPITAAGDTADAAKYDLLDLLAAVDTSGDGQIVLAGDQNLANFATLFLDEQGTMTPKGGTLRGCRFVVTDQTAAGELVAINPALIAAEAEAAEFGTSREASLIMSSVPSGGSPRLNLFQQDGVGAKVTMNFGIHRAATSGVAVLSSITWDGLATA